MDEQKWRARVEELECVSKRMMPTALEIARARYRPKRVTRSWVRMLTRMAEGAVYVVIFGAVGALIAAGV